MKGICLCSGGLDSTLALIKLLEQGHEVVPMFVDYCQWSLYGEMHSVSALRYWWDRGVDTKGKLAEAVWLWSRVLGEESMKVGSTWGRGIALVGLAAMWAYTHGDDFDFIALGNHRGDVGPDCKPGQFDANLHDTLLEATKGKIDLVLPIKELTIEDIGKELAKYRIPFSLMYSCYWYPPCGFKSKNEEYRCPGCRRKTLAMKAAGITNEKWLDFPNGKDRSYQSDLAEKVGY